MEIIDSFLVFMIIILIYVYLNQKKNRESFLVNPYNRRKRNQKNVIASNQDNEYCEYSENKLYNNQNLDISLENEKEIKKCIKQNNVDFIQSNKNNLVEFTNGKKHLGPVKNFHQCFNNENFKLNDLGWRNWWIKNKTKNNVKPTKNTNKFMENYLDNLEHLKNIYI